MPNVDDKHFTLQGDGQIYHQPDASNPLPGTPVARIVKGESMLRPSFRMAEDIKFAAEMEGRVKEWLSGHIGTVLEPLVALENAESPKPAIRTIAQRVYEALGVCPREDLEESIAALDAEDRRDLRSRKVRLGPLLVFIPALNKPAAVRLRGLLWALYHDKALPAPVPADGIVSCVLESESADSAFYRAIGYPVFGGRAVRIDMLDRVINAVYDSAKGGKFQARHEMAEWLGCSIEGLYNVLEAMGHRKISDPGKEEGTKETQESGGKVGDDEKPQSCAVQAGPQEQAKPALATFLLKKGKAFEKAGSSKKDASRHSKKEKPHKGDKKGGGKRNKSTHRSPKIMQVGPERKPEDSPFAVLEQLKVKRDGQG